MSRIFLLEDDPSLATGLSFAFEKQGYELCVAKTICEAQARWTEARGAKTWICWM